MPFTDDDIIDVILKYEGKYTNDPSDHGGPTNFGITALDYGHWLGRAKAASAEEVEAMDVATARKIYQKQYIADPGLTAISSDVLRLVLVDSGVLFGVSRAIKWLQGELRVTIDGDLGTVTAQAANSYTKQELLPRRILGRRLQAVAAIVKRDRSQLVFLGGWINRTVSLLDYT